VSCRRWRIEISALLDNQLAVEEQQAVERHISRCAECAAFHSEQEALHEQLQEAVTDFSIPSSIWARVEAGIRENQATQEVRKGFFWPLTDLLRVPRWGYGLVGAAAAVLTVFLTVQTRGPSQDQILSELDQFTVQAEDNPFLTEQVKPENPFFSYHAGGGELLNPFGGEEVSK